MWSAIPCTTKVLPPARCVKRSLPYAGIRQVTLHGAMQRRALGSESGIRCGAFLRLRETRAQARLGPMQCSRQAICDVVRKVGPREDEAPRADRWQVACDALVASGGKDDAL